MNTDELFALAAYHASVAQRHEDIARDHRRRENAANERAFDLQDEAWRLRDTEKLRRIARVADSDLALDGAVENLLPVLMADNPRDLDATDGEEPDRAEAYERRCNLQDRYNQ